MRDLSKEDSPLQVHIVATELGEQQFACAWITAKEERLGGEQESMHFRSKHKDSWRMSAVLFVQRKCRSTIMHCTRDLLLVFDMSCGCSQGLCVCCLHRVSCASQYQQMQEQMRENCHLCKISRGLPDLLCLHCTRYAYVLPK